MILYLQGMGCARCVKSVTRALTEIGATVLSCRVGSAEISGVTDVDKIREAVESVGFLLLATEE